MSLASYPKNSQETYKNEEIILAYKILIAEIFSAGEIYETCLYHLFFTDGKFDKDKFEKLVDEIIIENPLLDERWVKENFEKYNPKKSEFSPVFLELLRGYFSRVLEKPQENIENAKHAILQYIDTILAQKK